MSATKKRPTPKRVSKKEAPKKGGAKAPTPKRGATRAEAPRKNAEVVEMRIREIEALRSEVAKKSSELLPRWNANPEDVQKSVAQLVLALVEFLRKLLERQAIRRMEAESLDPDDVERIGLSLMKLEETVHDLAARFGLDPEELNLDLGPLGRLS